MRGNTWTAEELRTLLSSISHDLRTPLSVITGRASVLRVSAPELHRRELETIIHEAQRLSRTLENLLAVTANDAPSRREWVPVEEIVGSVLARLEPMLAGRAVGIDVPDNLLAHVDPVLCELLLANLLEHASRRTPSGTSLDVRAQRRDSAVILEVADRGAEAPPRPQDAEHTRSDDLALAACRRIAAGYGGTLELQKREGGGTLFHVLLPDGEPLPDLSRDPGTEGV